MKVSKILLPHDGSDHSKNATDYALEMAKLWGAHVTIVHCFDEWEAAVSEVPESLLAEIRRNKLIEAEKLLKDVGSLFQKQDVKHTVKAMPGYAGKVLTDMAKSKEYDMIIMGSHGHSDIAGLFLGSVTHKVLNTIHCPILIVP